MFAGPARKLLIGAYAIAACLVLFASLAPSSVSAPQTTASKAAINPLALMRPPPRDLPVERFDPPF